MENYCQLIFMFIFLISTVGSLYQPDPNAVYSLFGFYSLLTYRNHTSLAFTLNSLIVITVLASLYDVWLGFLAATEPAGEIPKIVTLVALSLELIMKLLLIVMLTTWSCKSTSKTAAKSPADLRESAVIAQI